MVRCVDADDLSPLVAWHARHVDDSGATAVSNANSATMRNAAATPVFQTGRDPDGDAGSTVASFSSTIGTAPE
jgi:hypothetical protein